MNFFLYKNSTYSLLINIIEKFSIYIVLIILSKAFGANIHGKLILAINLSNIFFIFAELGVSNYVLRETAKGKALLNHILSSAFLIRIYFLPLILIVSFFYAIFIIDDQMSKIIFLIISLSNIFNFLSHPLVSYFRGIENFLVVFKIYFVDKFFLVSLIFLQAIFFNNILSIVSVFVISSILRLFISYIYFKNNASFSFLNLGIKKYFKNFYLLALIICLETLAFRGEFFYLSFFNIDTLQIGYYSYAYSIFLIPTLFSNSVVQILFPHFSKNGVYNFYKILLLITVFTFISSILIYIFADLILSLLFNYNNFSIDYLIKLLPFMLFYNLNYFFQYLLISSNKDKTVCLILILHILIMSITCVYILVIYEIMYLPFAVGGSHILTCILLYICYYRASKHPNLNER